MPGAGQGARQGRCAAVLCPGSRTWRAGAVAPVVPRQSCVDSQHIMSERPYVEGQSVMTERPYMEDQRVMTELLDTTPFYQGSG